MVECHGSQCGFCTPGFVMSLWACYERHQGAGTLPTRQQLADDLSGNLCRCTGYRPILDAGRAHVHGRPARCGWRCASPCSRGLQALLADGPAAANAGRLSTRRAPWPTSLALRAAKPQAKVLAGSTDMGLWVTKQFRDLGELIYIGEVAELKTVQASADGTCLAHRRRRHAGRRLAGAGGAVAQPARGVAALCLAAHPAWPARWAATSPTARRSATRRRC